MIVRPQLLSMAAGFAVLGLALAGCGSTASDGPAHSSAAVVSPPPASAVSSPAPSSESPGSASSSSAPTDSPSAVASTFVMPNEVGQGLQAAQDDLQRVSGNPIFISHSTDASGSGRHQILDRDWKVCTQNIAAGTKIGADADVSFGAVKLSESCP